MIAMAAHDPGDPENENPKKNPWRRPQQSSVGWEQAWNSWKRQLTGLFGGGKPPGSGDGRGGRVGRVGNSSVNWGALAVMVLAIWATTGFYVVDAPERAVILRFGRYVQTTDQGLHWRWPWPIESKYIVNVARNESIEHKTHMLTSDENLVNITIAVQYLRSNPTQFLFKVREPEETLRDVSESAIREIVGQSTLEAVLGPGRQEITERTKALVQNTLNNYQIGIDVLTVNLTAVNVPDPVAPAQKDAIKAREDRDRFSEEAQAYTNDILPRARGAAARKLQEAQAYRSRVTAGAEGQASRFSQLREAYEKSPKITRERLYLETIEDVLSRSRKVLVDTKSGGNVLYLPLDKMLSGMFNSATPAGAIPPPPPTSGETQETESITVDPRSRGSR